MKRGIQHLLNGRMRGDCGIDGMAENPMTLQLRVALATPMIVKHQHQRFRLILQNLKFLLKISN